MARWKNSIDRIGSVFVLIVNLLILFTTIAFFSPLVAYNAYPEIIPVTIYIFLAGLAGCVFLYIVLQLRKKPFFPAAKRHRYLALFIGAGLLIRLMMFISVPILEDDWIRYLWEGAMGNAGVSPYIYAPADGFTYDDNDDLLPPSDDDNINRARQISSDHDLYAYEVTYPYLTTIYPSGAQAGFRLANMIAPFNLNAWRFVLLLSDGLALFVLLKLLSLWGRSAFWSCLYWLNPIVILEGFNSGHMDLLLVPPLLACLYFAHQKSPMRTGTMLGIAAAVKIWPLLLAPLFLRPLTGMSLNWVGIKNCMPPILRFSAALVGVSVIGLYPIVQQVLDHDSGLGAYAGEWRKNNLLFSLITLGLSAFAENPDQLARLFVAIGIIGFTLILSLRLKSVDMLPAAMLAVTATLFLLSPTGYPWYAIWFIPWLAFVPVSGLLLLTVTLSLYYLRFPLFVMGYDWIFNTIIAPIEFGIPLMVLILPLFTKRRLLSTSQYHQERMI